MFSLHISDLLYTLAVGTVISVLITGLGTTGQSAVRHLEVSYDGGVVRRTEVSYDGGVVRHLEVSYDGGVV